ncbi:type II toxin-antitoxin system HipA family toxin [Seleniivibrio woodruffii]|uniref:type II toxin-antitoxin system HipA family toxin n=1 Tax=Seleniivibrio woodruffii TaxID=1078050 RepID=UPI0026EA2502|nr:type II toxin-antitoxin system HipA family toxin [Seleniivibrio woodruffii]
MESLNVFIEIEGRYVKAGNLASTGHEIIFEYDDEYSFKGISLSMPSGKKLYEYSEAHVFFENLLPEARQREIIARAGRLSSANVYGLLKKYGGECAGAIVITEDDNLSEIGSSYEQLDEMEFEELVENLYHSSPAVKHKGYRLSLAGAQAKTSVKMDGNRVFLPLGTSPGTHIVKAFSPDFEGLPVNEALCAQLAKACGLPVCKTEVRKIGKTSALFIERYDRYENDDRIFRLHQEDFCQALGYSYALKYESEGGPDFARCVELVTAVSSRPAEDKLLLIRWFIFNFLTGNADAHAKNISLIYPQGMNGRPHLAPFYDLVCTGIYENLSKEQAMSVGGEFVPEKVTKEHWRKFAKDLGVNFRLIQTTFRDITEKTDFGKIADSDIKNRIRKIYDSRKKWLTTIL